MGSPPNPRPTAKRVVWDRQGNPTKYVSDALKIERWELRQAFHKIKARNNLGGADQVIVFSDGQVTDMKGHEIGNVFDEL